MTTSARPLRRSSSGRVSSSDVSMTVSAGQWNAPTRFLPSGRSIAVLPPIAASTWPRRVDGTGIQSTPRRYVAATKPARSVVEPPPTATSVEPRSSLSARQRRSASATVFAASPGGTVCVAAISWSSATRASATSASPVAVAMRAEPYARRGERRAVQVGRASVGRSLVQGPPLLVERAELVGVARERPIGGLRLGSRPLRGSSRDGARTRAPRAPRASSPSPAHRRRSRPRRADDARARRALPPPRARERQARRARRTPPRRASPLAARRADPPRRTGVPGARPASGRASTCRRP